MSIQINNNFDYKGNQPNFERDQFETLELMRSADERSFDNGHISYCIETGKHYVFNENNAIDDETGKWRLLIENSEDLKSALADYMNKATYDTNSNGIVDKAETLEGLNKTVNDLNNSLSNDDIIQGDNIEIIKNPNGSITISSTATGGDTKIEKFTYTDEEVTENLKGIWE